MVRLILQMSDLSGINFYIYKGNLIEKSNAFIYEISLHKYSKDGYSFLGSKFYKSDKLIFIKKDRIFKKYKDFLIEKDMNLVEAPQKFIDENRLKIYEPKIKKSKKK